VGEARQREDALGHLEDLGADFEDNELHVTGRVCARCGRPLAAGEDARLNASGGFQHEYCPA
jgi:hypothetical protein